MKIAVGCVADNNNKYLEQAFRLLLSWRWFGGKLASCDFYICVVDSVPCDFMRRCERYGAKIKLVSRFSEENPPSNKLRFLELPDLKSYDRVILMDCDTIVVKEPMGLLSSCDFAAKISDGPTVSLDIFGTLFSSFGISMPEASQQCTVRGESTIPYFNAGVLSFSRHAMDSLVPEWININQRLIYKIELLGRCRKFCEQASLSLAIVKIGTKFELLGNNYNFPAHYPEIYLSSEFINTDPVIIHYHSLIDSNGFLQNTPFPNVNLRILEFNVKLNKEKNRYFDNQSFWDDRYCCNPDLGSGLGSKGAIASYKRGLLDMIVKKHNPSSILDIGCGDMAVSNSLPARGYTGVDISKIIIEINKKKFPERLFICGDIDKLELKVSEILICLDFLIHLSDADHYHRTVFKCVRSAGVSGVISGYENAPTDNSKITFFHEPLSLTLSKAGAKNIRQIGAYRQVRVFLFDNRPVDKSSYTHDQDNFKNPIFVVGTMRSGTTLLANLLAQSKYIAHCPFELKDLWSKEGGISMASAKTRDRECPECQEDDFSQESRDRLTRAFLIRMASLSGKAPNAIFLNKNPHLSNKLQLVNKMFSNSRFIWIYRQLPQVVASLKRLFLDVCQRQSTWHWWPFPSPNIMNRCFNAFFNPEEGHNIPQERVFPGGNIKFLAEYWLETNRAISIFFSKSSKHSVFKLSQENLVESAEIEIANLQGFLGIPFSSIGDLASSINKQRNSHWRSLLTSQEVCDLSLFVQQNALNIDKIFDGEEYSNLYLKMLSQ